jgi:hypothetical protein
MNTQLIGTWVSQRSDIPGYRPGSERLRFTESGEHEWEMAQPSGVGTPSLMRFQASAAGDDLVFRAMRKSGSPVEWTVCITSVGEAAISVRPQHGHTTIFVREDQPNQSL